MLLEDFKFYDPRVPQIDGQNEFLKKGGVYIATLRSGTEIPTLGHTIEWHFIHGLRVLFIGEVSNHSFSYELNPSLSWPLYTTSLRVYLGCLFKYPIREYDPKVGSRGNVMFQMDREKELVEWMKNNLIYYCYDDDYTPAELEMLKEEYQPPLSFSGGNVGFQEDLQSEYLTKKVQYYASIQPLSREYTGFEPEVFWLKVSKFEAGISQVIFGFDISHRLVMADDCGPDTLSCLIRAVDYLERNGESSSYSFCVFYENNKTEISLYRREMDLSLCFLSEEEDEDGILSRSTDGYSIGFLDLKAAVLKETYGMLKKHGIVGYTRIWTYDHEGDYDFPIAQLLRLGGVEVSCDESNCIESSDAYEESEILTSILVYGVPDVAKATNDVRDYDRKVPDLGVFPHIKVDTPRLKDLWWEWVDEHATHEELLNDELGEIAFSKYAGLND